MLLADPRSLQQSARHRNCAADASPQSRCLLHRKHRINDANHAESLLFFAEPRLAKSAILLLRCMSLSDSLLAQFLTSACVQFFTLQDAAVGYAHLLLLRRKVANCGA